MVIFDNHFSSSNIYHMSKSKKDLPPARSDSTNIPPKEVSALREMRLPLKVTKGFPSAGERKMEQNTQIFHFIALWGSGKVASQSSLLGECISSGGAITTLIYLIGEGEGWGRSKDKRTHWHACKRAHLLICFFTSKLN